MVNATHTSFAADDRSYFAIIKKDIHKLAQNCSIPAERIHAIDLIVAELTSNLNKYAAGGEILAGSGTDERGTYVELISLDNGPGFRDLEKMMADGYSSAGTLGNGLGSIRRLSDQFDIYSQPGWGTIVLSRVYQKPASIAVASRPGVICRPLVVAKPGETSSGDGCFFQANRNGFRLMIADGLGHGPNANHAVNEAVEAFRVCTEKDAAGTIRHLHQAIKKTRGIVANIILYDAATRTWSAAGVGNIATRWMGGLQFKTQVSYNGIIGHNIPNTINDVLLKQEEYQQLIACSDGIRSRWDTSRFASLNRHDSMIQAAAIYKEHARRTDDMSVVICKVI